MNSPAHKSGVPERFSVDQANRMLPLVRAIAKDLVAQHELVEQLSHRLDRLGRSKSKKNASSDSEFTDEIEGFRRELATEQEKLDAYRHELNRLGVHTRSPIGHCDFPGSIDGQDIDLCWMPDEPEILFWHRSGADFDERRPLVAGAGAGFEDHSGDRSWSDPHE